MEPEDTELFWIRRELDLLEFARRTGGLRTADGARYDELCAVERRLLRTG
jgi:hypothetical protein